MFNIPTTVTDASARSAEATSTTEELDTPGEFDASENVDAGDAGEQQVDDAQDAEETGAPEAEEDERAPYIKRANFDKVNNEAKELREKLAAIEAKLAAPVQAAPDEWEPVRQEYQRLGLTPQAAAAQIAENKRQAEQNAYEQENQQIHQRVASEVNYEENPAAYEALFRAERAGLDLHKQAVTQAKHFAFQSFPDADLPLVEAFGSSPQVIENIARHTHARAAAIKENLTKDFEAKIETAKQQAVLEYIESQKKKPVAVERGGGNASARSAPQREPYKPGSGMRIPITKR